MSSVGIDFGTTNSVLATYATGRAEALEIDRPPADWAGLGFARVLPTVMALNSEGRCTFGWEAKTRTGEQLEAVKRLFREEEFVSLNGQQYVVEEIATMLFAHMKKRAVEQGVDATKAVVTIPANSRGLARYRTKLTAGMAGFQVLALINEPTAAAMAFSAHMPFDQRIMVVDWGGGTLDVTILQSEGGVFIEQASKGIQRLGGLDLDSRVAQRIVAATAEAPTWTRAEKSQFRLAVEKAKILLSTGESTNVELPRGGNFVLERAQLEHDIRPLVERVRQPIEQTLRDISTDSRAIDALVLVGGTCKIPYIRSLICETLGKDAVTGVDPMTAIAEGAAIAAAILTGEAPDNDFFVGTEHALGTYVHNDSGPRTFSEIIPRNHKLPASRTKTFYPASPESTQVLLDIVEGEPDSSESNVENVVLKTWPVPVDSSREDLADKGFDVTFNYDVDGILDVEVTDQKTRETVLHDDVAFGVSQDKRGLVQIAKRAQAAVDGGAIGAVEPRQGRDSRTMDLLQRARNRVIPFLDDLEAARIRHLVQDVESAAPGMQPSAVTALESALQPFSYLF